MSFPLLFLAFRLLLRHLVGGDHVDCVRIDFLEDHDDESTVKDITPNGRQTAGITVPFADGRGKNRGNIVNGQAMLSNVLDIAGSIVGRIPNEAGVFHSPILKLTAS